MAGSSTGLLPVDATILAGLELGQPTHAFDADKVVGPVTIRTSRAGEKAWPLFQPGPVEIPAGTLVIADDVKILAIAGVIGCEDSKTTADTKRLLLESATFDPPSVRIAARALGLATDASGRFERGGDPTAPLVGAGRVVHRHGPLWLWLRASSAIPGVLPPVLHHGEVYVDGALVDNLPTDVMAADGLAHLTAVSIRADIELRSGIEDFATPPWWRLLLQQRRGPRWPGLVSTLTRAAMVNSEETSERCRALAQRLITPPLDHIGMLDWKDWQRAAEAGYRETMRVLEAERA